MNVQELRKYLVSSCRYLQTDAGVVPPESNALWVEWVIARSECVCRSVDISAIAAGEVESVLNLQVREWSPFHSPEYHFEVLGNRALVWAWDGDNRRRLCREAGVSPDVLLPESLVLQASTESEEEPVILVQCLEGYEGRAYRGTRQVQSRWWKELPDLRSWNQFRMLFDLTPVESLPAPVSPSMPVGGGVSLQSMVLPFLRAESTLFVLFFALFLVAAAYQGGSILYSTVAINSAESQIEELNQAVTPVLQARDVALGAMETIEDIHSLHTGPLQLQYLADLLARLEATRKAGQDVTLVAWDYRSTGVSMSLLANDLSAEELLSIFEAIPWLEGQRVGEDAAKDRTRVTANLVPGWQFEESTGDTVAGT